jgi:hypothetical protein
MTHQERLDMFSKEVLTIKDISKLFEWSEKQSSAKMLEWKKKLTIGMGRELRIDMQGKMHRQDYYDVMGIQPDPINITYLNK